MKLLDRYIKNRDFSEILTKGFSFLLLRLLAAIIGYVFIWIVSNYYGSDVYGLIALGFSLFLILSIFCRLGFDTNIVRVFSQAKNEKQVGLFIKSLAVTFFASLALVTLVYLLKDFVVLKLYKEPKPELLVYLPWILAAIPFWNVALVSSSLLRAKQRNNAYAFINNPSRFLFTLTILLVIFLYYDKSSNYIVIAHFFGVLITCLISLYLSFKEIKKVSLKSDIKMSFFIKDSYPMLLSSSMLILLGLVDTQVMGIYETNTNIAIYNVCLKLAALTTFSLQSINSILAPKISKSYALGDNNYHKLIKFTTTLNFVVSSVIVLLIIIFHKYLLGFFGEEYKPGAIILLIFCFGKIIDSFSGSVGLILQMIGKQKVYQNFVVFALIINLILTFILTPIYGGVGAAISTVVSISFWNLGSALYLKKKMNIISYFQPIGYLKSVINKRYK